jgi:hypothetical protein
MGIIVRKYKVEFEMVVDPKASDKDVKEFIHYRIGSRFQMHMDNTLVGKEIEPYPGTVKITPVPDYAEHRNGPGKVGPGRVIIEKKANHG